MIIDDNSTHRILGIGFFGAIFSEKEVLSFESANAALEELSKDSGVNYLIFLDLYMPEMDGWQFLEKYELLNRKDQDKVFMLSSTVEGASIERARSHHMLDGFMSKPLTFHSIESVRKYLLKSRVL